MNSRDFAALRTLYLNGGAAIIDGKVARKFAAKGWVHIEVDEDDWAAQQSLVVPCSLLIPGAREYKAAVERRVRVGPDILEGTDLEGVTLDEVSSWEPPDELDLGGSEYTITTAKGVSAKVSEEDYDYLSQFTWYYNGKYLFRKEKLESGSYGSSYMHKEVLARMGITSPMGDHINRDKLDNRRSNLRAATPSQNQGNLTKQPSISGYRGVRPNPNSPNYPWAASLYTNEGGVKRTQYLGQFATKEEAALAYDRAAIERWGEYAALNFPDEQVSAATQAREEAEEEIEWEIEGFPPEGEEESRG